MRNGLLGMAVMALTLVGTAAGAEERLELKVGEKRVLTVKNLLRVALADPETADVETKGLEQLEVTGKAPGTTKLLTWGRKASERREYTVVVTP